MKLAIALLCALFLLGAQSAVAGGCAKGKGGCVKTTLVPTPVVEEKPLLPKKECVWVERKTMSTEPSRLYSITPMPFENCGCCGTTQTYMPGTTYYRPEQKISGVVITTDCE